MLYPVEELLTVSKVIWLVIVLINSQISRGDIANIPISYIQEQWKFKHLWIWLSSTMTKSIEKSWRKICKKSDLVKILLSNPLLLLICLDQVLKEDPPKSHRVLSEPWIAAETTTQRQLWHRHIIKCRNFLILSNMRDHQEALGIEYIRIIYLSWILKRSSQLQQITINI